MGAIFVTDRKPKQRRLFTNGEDDKLYLYEQTLREFNSDVDQKHAKMHFSQNRPKLHPFDQCAVDGFKSAKEFFENVDKTGSTEGVVNEPTFNLDERLAQIGDQLAHEHEGEEYSAPKDMQDAYYKSLSTSLADQIYQTIPEHAFWDIKVPLTEFSSPRINQYNPCKPPTTFSFFEHRINDEWMERYKKKRNTRDSISLFRAY